MMNFYGLKYFYDACRFKSMTKAAEINHVSRPAISQAILKLESDLQVELLVHKRRGIELTQRGLVLMKRAEKVFHELDGAESALKREAGMLEGTLTIGAAQALATFLLQKAVAKLKIAHPALEVKIRIRDSQGLVDRLSKRELDVAFFLGDETRQGYRQTVIKKGVFQLIRPKAIKKDRVLYAISEPRPETQRVRSLYEERFSDALPVFAEIASWDAIWTWMNEGLCGGLVPDFLLQKNKPAAKKFTIVLDKVWPYEIKVMVPVSRVDDPAILAFLSTL